MQQKEAVCVLISPLDWGLGHATRCIPIIKELEKAGIQVLIAASGPIRILLKQEFPGLEFLEIPGYQIRYRPGFWFKWALLLKIPSIQKQIKTEHAWLAERCRQHKIDAVISDNRYGLYHEKVFCVFITHQLSILSGLDSSGNSNRFPGRFIDRVLLKWNYAFISKFSACWVPDQNGEVSIAGKLSHPPVQPPVPLKYIGILSRFKPVVTEIKKNSLLILLSGPEPHRSIFENMLFHQLAAGTRNAVVVRGLPDGGDTVPFIRAGVEVFNHLDSDALNNLLAGSEYIIARSGYSTVMDLVRMKKNAILIPTPGQTEQEYLGRYLNSKKWMYTVMQNNFNLENALKEFRENKWLLPETDHSLFPGVMKEFISWIRA